MTHGPSKLNQVIKELEALRKYRRATLKKNRTIDVLYPLIKAWLEKKDKESI